MVKIQVQFSVGEWRDVSSVNNTSQYIIRGMTQAQKSFPGRRVRAVDSDGRLLDMM